MGCAMALYLMLGRGHFNMAKAFIKATEDRFSKYIFEAHEKMCFIFQLSLEPNK
jgi:hypothetical protein